MLNTWKIILTLVLLCLFLGFSPVNAKDLERPESGNGLHSAWVYQLLCYATMPDTGLLEARAKEFGFTPVEGDALKAYAPQEEATYLKAWEFSDHNRNFKVASSISKVDSEMAGLFPDFANGSATGCSVILPALDDPKTVSEAMRTLVEREADATINSGPFKIDTWTGATQENVFIVQHFSPISGAPGGLISLMTLSK